SVAMIVVAAIISSSESARGRRLRLCAKPQTDSMPRFRLVCTRADCITCKLRYFGGEYGSRLARVHATVAVVIAVNGDGHVHQPADNAAVGYRVGAAHRVANRRLPVGREIAGYS